MDPRTQRIHAVNDELRQKPGRWSGGHDTQGVAALGREAVDRIVKTIAVFDDFATPTAPTVGSDAQRRRRLAAADGIGAELVAVEPEAPAQSLEARLLPPATS